MTTQIKKSERMHIPSKIVNRLHGSGIAV